MATLFVIFTKIMGRLLLTQPQQGSHDHQKRS
jgi:hypothetical protein